MTDDRQPTPAEEAEIARLLAEAATPVPTPPAVVERLDDVLAELLDERSGAASPREPQPDEPPVDDLPQARARRRWPKVLLAAAAVVAGGYGVGAALDQGSLAGSDSAGGASTSAEAGGGSAADTDERAAKEPRSGDRGAFNAVAGVAQLRSDRLDADVRRVLRSTPALDAPLARGPKQAEEDLALTKDRLRELDATCVPPVPTDGRWYLVRLDDRLGALVADPAADGEVTATVYSCGGDVLAETVVAP